MAKSNGKAETNSNGKHPGGAPKGSRNHESHGIITFQRAVRRRTRRGRSVIDRRSSSGRNAVAFQQALIADQGGTEENLSAAKLALIELNARDTYFCDEIDRRICNMIYRAGLESVAGKKYGAKSLSVLYGYRQSAARSLASNLLALGLDKAPPRQKTLDEILNEAEETETTEAP